MYNDKRILALVTARGGSKGLPGKNIRPLHGKPLVCWTLETAKCSRYIDEIFVSTDSAEIARVCEECGISVPHLRPARLAQDHTSSVEVALYTIDFLENAGREYDYLLLLEPTSPLREAGDLDNIISLAAEHPEADGVISVGRVHLEHPSIVKRISESGYLQPYVKDGQQITQRQQEDDAFFPYGVGYLVKTESLRSQKTIYAARMLPYFIERWKNYEIDDIYDFECIAAIMEMEREKIWGNTL